MDDHRRGIKAQAGRAGLLLVASMAFAGCQFGQLPNQEDVEASAVGPEALQKRLGRARSTVDDRILRRQLSPEEGSEILRDYVVDLLADVDVKAVAPDEAWMYGDLFRQIPDWQATYDLYSVAVEHAESEDRRVNDSLRLAEATAELGDVEEGIRLVRSTFDASAGGKGPILMATLYEFLPSARRQGMELQLAALLEDAIDQHLMTVVDPSEDAGRRFLISREHHVREAWSQIIILYHAADEEERALGATVRYLEMMRRFATL
ncbi:MAG: hypothetical protein IH944_13535 [Armatimonadetes bacterium]|nr:hypothetical protein [Armatimonadota bacterium]